ncbi:AzlC family ABC transporter permease [Geosporobacter ferrireducens]|uniref:AzlC family ABC transporter permease n=1 Tax=Geosporobacter ferrireducens TaxID=1424294 RepID=UPI00139C39B4|nr:AzlC family ABC transporter permease [Geosporobacter ferrireducens]MTI57465.1 branched-chain amino acid ABC transporter permease [Geosporobacter ferrireducens]
METENRISAHLKEGFISALPLMLGYFPVAMSFGLLSKTTDISFRDSSLFSLLVFAGASQFMALDLIKAGVAAGNIILATFLLNLRHLMMSASLSLRLREIKKHWLIFIAFGITDEFFSITSLSNRKLNAPFLLALHGASYCSWVFGTMAGYLAGAVLPMTVQRSLGIGLYATFAALLVPEIKKSQPVLFLSIVSAMIYIIIDYFKIISPSWSLITAIIVASAIGVLCIKDDVKEVEV